MFSDPAIREWHARVEPLVLFYIDGATFIDTEDPKWEIVCIFSKTTAAAVSDWELAAFATIYRRAQTLNPKP